MTTARIDTAGCAKCKSRQPRPTGDANLTIALAGNPNAGKSTIFNALTGSHQHVGNWPGKTVEKKEGRLSVNGGQIAIVDLPGTYSLTAYSIEEVIARDFIVNQRPDAVVAVVDSANLERNLYLVVQLLEMNVPVVLALNMMDVAERRHISIDQAALAQQFGGIPVITTVGSRQVGLDTLRATLHDLMDAHNGHRTISTPILHFDDVLERAITDLQTRLDADAEVCACYPTRWLAIKLLEADPDLLEVVSPALREAAHQCIQTVTTATGEEPDTLIADQRYAFIADVARQVITRPAGEMVTLSEKIDRVMTHRLLGLPIFLLLMWFVFQITANVSAPYLDWIDALINGPLTRWTGAILSTMRLDSTWFASLVVDGVIAGVGGVLVFIPVLFSLYTVIAILEDSGYMARAAFVMDRSMRVLGLHGKSFLPLLVGFGCTVPGIYATRTLENEQDRKITAFLTTFMSCGARLPVYVIFGAAFFGAGAGNLIFALYLVGIGVAIITSLLLTRVVYRNKITPPFVMELPPYRVPYIRHLFVSVWRRTMEFVRSAGTIILGASVAIWFLLAIPIRDGGFNDVEPEDSAFGTASRLAAPVFEPAGYGQWEGSGSLVMGFLAKEAVISTMSQIYVGEGVDEPQELTPSFTDDVAEIGGGLADATVLTIQEFINIGPRTLNLIPGLAIPEAALIDTDAQDSATSLEAALRDHFSTRAAVAFSVFVLLYVPCMGAVAAMRHEFGTRWMLAQVFYTLGVAWLVSVLVYQFGGLVGL